jgi:hypothetical protein
MIPLASRGAIPLLIAVTLMVVPVLYLEMNKRHTAWCNDPEATLADRVMPDVATQETASTSFGGLAGETSGTLALPGTWLTPPRFRIARSFSLDQYYFVPRRTFITPYLDDRLESFDVEVDGVELPLHLRVDESLKLSRATLYFYVLAGRPVRGSFFGSLAQALPQLLRGRLPLTMVLVQGSSAFEDEAVNRATLIDWTQRAWTHYDEACDPS